MRRTPLTALLACLLALGAAPVARASTVQPTIFQDDGRLLHAGADVRDRTLDEIAAGGAQIVKLHLVWADVAPGGETRPDGFSGHELSSYPEAAWSRYDDLIQAATARGLRVLVAPTTPAPGWATPAGGDSRGVERPNAVEYGRFVRAAGVRYDGSHGQPRVDFWTILNEPNHPHYLLPQGSRGRLVAPHLYRELVRRAAIGLQLSGHGTDTILFGELLPIGKAGVGPRQTIKPVAFLREFFCLDRAHRPFRGRAARVRGCTRFRRLSAVLTGFGYHPYTRPGGPGVRERSADDATIRSLGRIARVLDRAVARRRLAGGRRQIYNTEFGYQSDPPDPFQTRLSRIPRYLNEAEWIAWRNPRVATWSQYALLDDPLSDSPGPARYGGFQSGLRFADGTEKPGVYEAYRMPIFVRRIGRSTVEVWGGARAAGAGQLVQIQSRTGSGEFTDLPGATATTGAGGYFRRRVRVSAADRRAFRFRLANAAAASRATKAVRR